MMMMMTASWVGCPSEGRLLTDKLDQGRKWWGGRSECLGEGEWWKLSKDSHFFNPFSSLPFAVPWFLKNSSHSLSHCQTHTLTHAVRSDQKTPPGWCTHTPTGRIKIMPTSKERRRNIGDSTSQGNQGEIDFRSKLWIKKFSKPSQKSLEKKFSKRGPSAPGFARKFIEIFFCSSL